ncbi:MAG: nucleoid occlusion factor SlmA [Gammaproteobacteria bacterium]|nr:MAG: nucleoid occlusion factor SlmA [Gammaproteobacteria bacterium]
MTAVDSEVTPRRQQILEALARELEQAPGQRITTAVLARSVGVSEAALYRHFPSKARIFEGLLGFAEETVFGRVGRILEEAEDAPRRCEHILALVLAFGERNPGITRVLIGDALIGETPRVRARVEQFVRRLDTQLKQVLREGEMRGELPRGLSVGAVSGLLVAVVAGRLLLYVQSGFREKPTRDWDAQWRLLVAGLRDGVPGD